MTRQEWDELREALAFARGSGFMLPAPEFADPKHAAALCRFAQRMESE